MLKKDEYNQEEYNDYYKQEVEGAELGASSGKRKGKGLISKIIIFPILSIAAYFGYNAMQNSPPSNENELSKVVLKSSLPKSVQNIGVTQNEPEKNNTLLSRQSIVQSESTKTVEKPDKMSPTQIAAVVAAVMQKINDKKASDNSSINTPTKEDLSLVNKLTDSKNDKKASDNSSINTPSKEDLSLVNKLTDSKVDSISDDLIQKLEEVDLDENQKIDNKTQQIDVYNKVNVQNITTDTNTLSKLSNQINSLITDNVSTTVTEYSESLKDEINVRKNEMRIIVVQEGDTLGKIAKRAYGNSSHFNKIYQANPEVTRPDRIYIGQKLRIPN